MTARLQDWLIAQAQSRPLAPAVVFREQVLPYGELDRASNRLARALRIAGCVRGDRVALLLPKSPRALIAMLGALKADCIYVPIDTASPAARIARILRSCECRCLIAEHSTAGVIQAIAADPEAPGLSPIVWMDGGAAVSPRVQTWNWTAVEAFSAAPVDSQNTSADPAHILFTSGSTGTPKGVVITHANVIHFVDWAVKYFGMGPMDRISGHAPLHFDLSTFDIYGALAAGAQVHLVPPEVNLLPHRLADFIRDSRLTQWFSVPSALLPLAKFDVLKMGDFPTLERLLWCGEKFPVPALMYCMQRLSHVAFFNLYGPTEATIASSYYRVPRCPTDDRAEIPIGAACRGETLLVLNENLETTAPGETGDLYISGPGLSPGYWRDPEQTARVFLSRRNRGTQRIYKTGDRARIGADGWIYLLGRSDSQIKSRGYRIELGEIETAIQAVPGVQEAAVIAWDPGDSASMAIACAFVRASGSDLSEAALKKAVSSKLPQYMLPSRWMALDRLPLNGNGKTDRKMLRQKFIEEPELPAILSLPELPPLETAAGKSA